MGRYRNESKGNYGRRSEKNRKADINRYDDSDHSSFFSDGEDPYRDGYDGIGGSMRSRSSHKNRKNWNQNDYHSDSDDSYNPTKQKNQSNSFRSRTSTKNRSRAHSHNGESDSDESDAYGSRKGGMDRPRSDRSRREPRNRGENRKGYESDERSHFSARIQRMKREQSFDSDEDSRGDPDSSRHVRNSNRNLQGSGIDSNHLQQPRSLRSRQQLTKSMSQRSSSLNSSFSSQEPITQTTIPTRNNPQLLPSTSIRSTGQMFFPGQQHPASPMVGNQSLLNQVQGQRLGGVPTNNLQGNPNPRLPSGPGHMMRSTSARSTRSARSMNTFSSAPVQPNHSIQHGIVQSPIQPTTSQRSLGNNNALMEPPIQRQGLVRGASNRSLGHALPYSSVHSQQQGLIRATSQHSLGNNEALHNTPVNYQRPGLTRGVSKGTLGNNDGFANTLMHSPQPGLVRGASQNGLVNNNQVLNNPMNIQHQGLMRGQSQRSLGNTNALLNASSTHSNPYMRINTPQQLYSGTKNQQWMANSSKPSSIAGDSVMVMSGVSGDTSILSSKSRGSEPPASLADQIYSRNRSRHNDAQRSRSRSRHNDTQSLGSYADPPGVDCNDLKVRAKKNYSDDTSFVSFADEQESYIANDPPDMFDDDRIYSDVTDDESVLEEPTKVKYERQVLYNEGDSKASSFDEGDMYNYKIRLSKNTGKADPDPCGQECGESVSGASISSGSCGETSVGKSSSRFSSDLAFEYDAEIAPPQRSSSVSQARVKNPKKKENDKKDKLAVESAVPRQESLNWLAQQISNRKLTDTYVGSRSLEPEGASTDGQIDSITISSTYFSNVETVEDDTVGCNGTNVNVRKDLRQPRDKTGVDKMSSLPPEIDYVLKYEASDMMMPSSAKIKVLGSDNSTTTTDTMTQEVPSVIMSMNEVVSDSYSDSDSDSLFLSFDDESSTKSPRKWVADKNEKKRDDPLLDNRHGKSTSLPLKKRSHTGVTARIDMQLNEKRCTKTTNKKKPTNDDISREARKSSKAETMNEQRLKKKKSPKKKKVAKEKRSKKLDMVTTGGCSSRVNSDRKLLKTAATQKPKQTRNFDTKEELVEKVGLENQSVINLIDQLKSFELDR